MGFGASLGYSAASSGLGTMFESANSVHQWEANNAGFMGFLDPLGTAFGSILNSSEKNRASKQYKYEKKLMKLRYNYQKLSALEMPALVRQGYEDAGYNALLAFNGGNVASPVSSGDGSGYPHESTKSNRQHLDPLVAASLKQAEAQTEQTKANTLKTKVGMVTDILGSVLGVGGLVLAAKKLAGKFPQGAWNAKGGPAERLVDIPLKTANKGQMLGKLALALPMLGKLGLYGAGAAGGIYGYNKFLDYVGREGGIKPISKDHPRYRHENGTWLKPRAYAPKRRHN